MILVVITINFFLPRAMPGDPFLILSVEEEGVATSFTSEQIEYYKDYYGFDKPLYIQFFNYIKKLLHGDLGNSIYYDTSVVKMILIRMPWTLFIVICSLFISSFLGTIFGAISAYLHDKVADKAAYMMMIVFSEIPSFLVGLLLLLIFAAKLKIFPLSGGITAFSHYTSTCSYINDILHHAALPIATLSLTGIGGYYLLSRNSMMSVLTKDYMNTARAKGVGKRRILFKHALRNSLPPIIARLFMSLGNLFGGAVLVENVFAYPGVGKLMSQAVRTRDYVLIQGVFLMVALTMILMNWIADKVYKKLDPRIM